MPSGRPTLRPFLLSALASAMVAPVGSAQGQVPASDSQLPVLQLDTLGGRGLPSPLPTTFPRYATLADVDGDGDLDLLSLGLRLFSNDGTGRFEDVTAQQMPATQGFPFVAGAASGDIDGDGDLDLAFSVLDGPALLYVNDGTGTYTDVTGVQLPVDSTGTRAVTFADIDGDGDVDLLFGASNRIYINDGAGNFSNETAARWGSSLGAVQFDMADVDGDQDLDLLVSTGYYASGQQLLINDGDGFFTLAGSQIPGAPGWAVVRFADIDNDGDPDALFGQGDTTFGPGGCGNGLPYPDRLFLNDGTGVFVDGSQQLPPLSDATMDIAVADIDEDGDLDILTASWTGQNRLLLNDGLGSFDDVSEQRLPVDVERTNRLAVGDVDGDGDADLIVGSSICQSAVPTLQVQYNLFRQLHAPHAPQVGQPFALEAYSRYGASNQNSFALVSLSTTRTSILRPGLGTQLIVPMRDLPAASVSPGTGLGSTVWDVPNLSALIGVEIFAQAVIVPGSGQARFSNLTGGQIE